MTLRVTFEIVPHGDESRKRQIDMIEISNVGPSDYMRSAGMIGDYCDYRIEGTNFGVTGHCRQLGARELLRRALEVMDPSCIVRTSREHII